MLKKPHYIILGLVVLLVIVLLKLPGGAVGRVKLALSGMFLPLFGLSGSAHELSAKASQAVVSKDQLARQNEDLRRENEELKIHLEQDAAIWNENARLRSLVGWPKAALWKFKLARVIARDPANWWRTAQIDLGARDGVKTNCAVLTSDGLVGRVQSVGQTRSQITLLGNPDLRVAAFVQPSHEHPASETGVIGVASSSPQENNWVDLDYLPGNSALQPGQNVVTWGEGGVFPPGIPIGQIVDVRAREYGLASEARVKLWADMDALEEVWVMMP
jgi:rod shape-determining protein MreC